uniref:Uncharacterized protein n=1 Tax=Arundo donax TaxID=35708 RepID=A0A0A9HAQ5_ARUDO
MGVIRKKHSYKWRASNIISIHDQGHSFAATGYKPEHLTPRGLTDGHR